MGAWFTDTVYSRGTFVYVCQKPVIARRILTMVLDYCVQAARFSVYEGFGCAGTFDASILSLLVLYSWYIIIPLISITIYYRECRVYPPVWIISLC